MTYRFTVKDYHRMAEADIFDPEARVELLDGEVVEMSPIGTSHGACVDRVAQEVVLALGRRAIVRVQGAIQIGEFSEPQPDLAVLLPRADFYLDQQPMPPDILLAVEVADSSLRYDLVRKAPFYLAAGVPEVWVIDLTGRVLHVFRSGLHIELRAGESVSPEAFPDLVLEVATILP